MGNSLNQVIGELADTLYVDPVIDGKIDDFYASRLPKSKRLGSVKELIALKEFYESVSCLLVEGVEFMDREELYLAIKGEWVKTNAIIAKLNNPGTPGKG
ncbi:MAG TPA: hypothetical protein DCS09_08850 [Porphyromonadaceae bacterium]|nr:hypothetical protein [Porphyromonadaceae bacterium]